MTTDTCDACKSVLQPLNNIWLKIGEGHQHLCARCYNEVMAEYHNIDFENIAFDPISLKDKDGADHTFSFRTRLLGDIVAMDAVELKDNDLSGYQFQVIGKPEDDLLLLYQYLYEKMKRGLSIKHIQPDELTRYSITVPGIVRGHITSDPDGENDMPVVVIDGKEISWAEFGKMVSTYMGFNFKLELYDKSEEK